LLPIRDSALSERGSSGRGNDEPDRRHAERKSKRNDDDLHHHAPSAEPAGQPDDIDAGVKIG
jgi:hypothetical protein